MTIKTIFLDRDGVINKEVNYLHKIEDFEFIDGVFETLKYLKNKGYLLFIITNQSGIGRAYYSLEDFNKISVLLGLNIPISKSPMYGCVILTPILISEIVNFAAKFENSENFPNFPNFPNWQNWQNWPE